MTQLLFERETERGEVVYGRPLAPYVRQNFTDQAKALYPDPDVTPFIQPPDPDALTPELGKQIAEQEALEHPDYLKLKEEVALQRRMWLWDMTLKAGVIVDTPEGRAKTLERYRDELEHIRALLTDPIKDDWLACVVYCLIVSYKDLEWIYRAAWQQISEDAQLAAVRYFRRDVQR